MAQTQERIKMIVSIVGHGQSKSVIRFYEKNQVRFHYRCLGRGTASSELLDVLGLGGTEREIVFSLAAGSIAGQLMCKLRDGGGESVHAKGIAFMMPLSAISNLPGIPLLKEAAHLPTANSSMPSHSKSMSLTSLASQWQQKPLTLKTLKKTLLIHQTTFSAEVK